VPSAFGVAFTLVAAVALVGAVFWECKVLYRAHVELQPAFHEDALLFFGDKDVDRTQTSRTGCVGGPRQRPCFCHKNVCVLQLHKGCICGLPCLPTPKQAGQSRQGPLWWPRLRAVLGGRGRAGVI
jgi:hypothetical protein